MAESEVVRRPVEEDAYQALAIEERKAFSREQTWRCQARRKAGSVEDQELAASRTEQGEF